MFDNLVVTLCFPYIYWKELWKIDVTLSSEGRSLVLRMRIISRDLSPGEMRKTSGKRFCWVFCRGMFRRRKNIHPLFPHWVEHRVSTSWAMISSCLGCLTVLDDVFDPNQKHLTTSITHLLPRDVRATFPRTFDVSPMAKRYLQHTRHE